MYKVGILEDDASHAELLAHMLRESSFASRLDIVGVRDCAEGPLTFEDWAASLDILFADIRLGDEGQSTGIDVVKKIAELGICPQVIYVSGVLEYISATYYTEHVWFLAKPYTAADLDAALSSAIDSICAERDSAFVVRQGTVLESILPSQITYIESDRRKVCIHMKDREVETYAKPSELAAKLPARFAQCHKSFLVNMDCITRLEATTLVLEDGACLPVSRGYRKQLVDAYIAHAGRMI